MGLFSGDWTDEKMSKYSEEADKLREWLKNNPSTLDEDWALGVQRRNAERRLAQLSSYSANVKPLGAKIDRFSIDAEGTPWSRRRSLNISGTELTDFGGQFGKQLEQLGFSTMADYLNALSARREKQTTMFNQSRVYGGETALTQGLRSLVK